MANLTSKQSQTREQLKEYFKNGKIPTGQNYADLIDSMVHKVDDGVSKDEEGGLNIHSAGESMNLVSFYPEVNAPNPFFRISKDQRSPENLKLQTYAPGAEGGEDTGFFFGKKGNLGLGKPCDSQLKLEVKGFAGMEGRIGTYRADTVDADGEWHPILEKLNNCSGFEVIARTGKKNKGKFAMMHAIALSAYGRKGGKIKKTRTHYGFFWNKLNLRWVGGTTNYQLQIRTNSNYGPGVKIYYRITKLWEDHAFLGAEEYHHNE